MTQPPVDPSALRLPAAPLDLLALPTDATPGFTGDKDAGEQALAALAEELGELQEKLWAQRSGAGTAPRVLLVLQGMDTSGKGGVLRHCVGLVDPQGVRIKAFKAPTEEEKQHDFLWRIANALPEPGHLGVFDRSHYEDVLIHRVHGWADAAELERRYDAINAFEADLVEDGVVVVKVMLHISADEQRERLRERLTNPAKHWKYNPGDVDERARWAAYREAYQVALTRTDTAHAPWHVVPADRKWYRNLAVTSLLLRALQGLDLDWPAADFDPEAELARLAGLEVQ